MTINYPRSHESLTCVSCGLPQSLWQPRDVEAYSEDEQRYCCEGCEQGTGCTCQSAPNTRD